MLKKLKLAMKSMKPKNAFNNRRPALCGGANPPTPPTKATCNGACALFPISKGTSASAPFERSERSPNKSGSLRYAVDSSKLGNGFPNPASPPATKCSNLFVRTSAVTYASTDTGPLAYRLVSNRFIKSSFLSYANSSRINTSCFAASSGLASASAKSASHFFLFAAKGKPSANAFAFALIHDAFPPSRPVAVAAVSDVDVSEPPVVVSLDPSALAPRASSSPVSSSSSRPRASLRVRPERAPSRPSRARARPPTTTTVPRVARVVVVIIARAIARVVVVVVVVIVIFERFVVLVLVLVASRRASRAGARTATRASMPRASMYDRSTRRASTKPDARRRAPTSDE